MPLIAYPSVNIGRHPDESADTVLTFPVDRTRLVLDTPGRVVHENPETRDVVIVNRGPTLWMFTLTFGAIETETELHREFERWLARMHDLRNYSPVPLGTRAYGGTLTSNSITVTAKTARTLTLSSPMLIADSTPPPGGIYLRLGNRLGMLESVTADGTQITVTPDVGDVGNSVSVADSVLVRMAGTGDYQVATHAGLTDPLTVPFQEAFV